MFAWRSLLSQVCVPNEAKGHSDRSGKRLVTRAQGWNILERVLV
jgi:hypothetical protein